MHSRSARGVLVAPQRETRFTPAVVLSLIAATWLCVAVAVILQTSADSSSAGETLLPTIGLVGLGVLVVLGLLQIRRELRYRTRLDEAAAALALERVIQVTDVGLNGLPID